MRGLFAEGVYVVSLLLVVVVVVVLLPRVNVMDHGPEELLSVDGGISGEDGGLMRRKC